MNSINKGLVFERFFKKLHSSGSHRLNGHGDRPVSGYENDRKTPRCSQLFLKVKAAQAWHSHVENQTGRTIMRSACEKFTAEANVSTLRPTDLMSLARAFLTESSSSTMKTKGSDSVIAPCLSVSGL